eukprot:TRINITY_DN1387_c0_g1_i3.p1 TRINITY_DN1387_c0_g1~~TRINITY_DN1387_c0_g1_i3.p1  ORF type:complete len:1134 (+),score=185.44 TRINITY_DN1387_c0_g1_i3:62-3403(+)
MSDKEQKENYLPKSSVQQDYLAPPLDAFRQAVLRQSILKAGDAAKVKVDQPLLEKQSCMLRDFPPPPIDALKVAFQPVSLDAERDSRKLHVSAGEPVVTRSVMQHEYQPPPASAFYQAFARQGDHVSSSAERQTQNARFEGQSSVQRDYLPPPRDALLASLTSAARVENLVEQDRVSLGKHAMIGQSSMQRDFQAPPLEALDRQFVRREEAQGRHLRDIQQLIGSTDAKLVTESCMRRDYMAPPADALLEAFRPLPKLGDVNDSSGIAQPFNAKSSAQLDYPPPPTQALYQALVAKHQAKHDDTFWNHDQAKFEGQSSAQRDYVAPPKAALEAAFQPTTSFGEPLAQEKDSSQTNGEFMQSSMRYDYKPPPTSALLQHRSQESQPYQSESRPHDGHVKFEGRSSTQQDFPPPPPGALLAAFSPSVGAEGNADVGQHRAAEFTGESSTRLEYKPPPMEALLQSLRASADSIAGFSKAQHSQLKFEGESSTRRDFQPPPASSLLAAFQEPRPADRGRDSSRDRATAKTFECVSSSRLDYQPPPMEALRQSFLQRASSSDRIPKHEINSAKFEGQSCVQRDFPPPPASALLQAFQPLPQAKIAAKSETNACSMPIGSSMKEDYKPPPREALYQPFRYRDYSWPPQISSKAKYEGCSSIQRDLQPPPYVQPAECKESAASNSRERSGAFSGESSMRRDYQPYPAEVLSRSFQAQGTGNDISAFERLGRASFEGESSMRRDYVAPPADALRAALRPTCSIDGHLRSKLGESQDAKHHSKAQHTRFQGESSMRRDYQPPPPQLGRLLREPYTPKDYMSSPRRGPDACFEASSSAVASPARSASHPPRSTQREEVRLGSGCELRTSMQRDYQAPPVGAFLDAFRNRRGSMSLTAPATAAKFDGQSSMRLAFQPPPADALRAAFSQDFGAAGARSPAGMAAPRARARSAPPCRPRASSGSSASGAGFGDSPASAARLEGARRPQRSGSCDRVAGVATGAAGAGTPVRASASWAPAGGASVFDAVSSMRRDFQPPPADAFRQAFAAGACARSAAGSSCPATPARRSQSQVRFEGESSMRRDFAPPPPPQVRFEGESSMRRDFAPPPPPQVSRTVPAEPLRRC